MAEGGPPPQFQDWDGIHPLPETPAGRVGSHWEGSSGRPDCLEPGGGQLCGPSGLPEVKLVIDRQDFLLTEGVLARLLPGSSGAGIPDGAQEEGDARDVLHDHEYEGLVEGESRDGAGGDHAGGCCRLHSGLGQLQGGLVLDAGDHQGPLGDVAEVWGRKELSETWRGERKAQLKWQQPISHC